MPFGDHLDRLDEAVISHLGDGPCTYQGVGFTATDIAHILERGFEVYDTDQIPMRVTTIEVRVSDVSHSEQGDSIVTPSRTWSVQQVLEDDGYWRRLWVS